MKLKTEKSLEIITETKRCLLEMINKSSKTVQQDLNRNKKEDRNDKY